MHTSNISRVFYMQHKTDANHSGSVVSVSALIRKLMCYKSVPIPPEVPMRTIVTSVQWA